MGDVERPADLAGRDRTAAKRERRSAGRNPQLGDSGQQVDRFLGQAVQKYSCSLSALMLTNGSTAIECSGTALGPNETGWMTGSGRRRRPGRCRFPGSTPWQLRDARDERGRNLIGRQRSPLHHAKRLRHTRVLRAGIVDDDRQPKGFSSAMSWVRAMASFRSRRK